MAAGYAFGALLLRDTPCRRGHLCAFGLSLIVAWASLRALNTYGDPQPWSVQRGPLFTVLSFLNCTKYPPSLLFLLMTLGPAILILGLLDRAPVVLGHSLVTLGRVPLFFYLIQWPLVHMLALIVALVRGRPTGWLFEAVPFRVPPDCSYDLPTIYLMWSVAIALLYPACRRFAELKQRRRDAWLRYL